MTAPTDPVDQLAVTEIARLLSRISVVNGYRTNAGQYVVTEENFGDIPDDAMSLEIHDDDEETSYQGCRRRSGALQITVAANLPQQEVTEATRAQARRVLADIRQALSDRTQQNFPYSATGLEIGGRSMFFRDAGSRFFRPELRLRLSFSEHH